MPGGILGDAASGAAGGAALGPWGALAGGAIGAAGGLISDITGQNAQQQAVQDYALPGATYEGISPGVDYGQVSGVPGTAFNNADQTGNTALKDALSQLQAKYSAGGLTANDINEASQLSQAQGSEASAQRAAVQQQAQARGQSNSNLNYISQLVGGQQAASQAMQASQGQAANAEQQRMAALQGATAVGGELQKNAYQVANANDAINMFNKNIQVSNSQGALQASQNSVQNALGRAAGLTNVAAGQAGQQNNLANMTQQGNANAATSLSGLPQLITGTGGGGGGNTAAVNQNNQNANNLGWYA